MRYRWAAAAALAICSAASAQELSAAPDPGTPNPASTLVGVGIICNTAQQAESFVDLRARGTAPHDAMLKVNADAKDPRACGVAAVAFVRDATLKSQAVNDKLVQVVRIDVLAGFNGSVWQHVTGMVQYAVIEGQGEAI